MHIQVVTFQLDGIDQAAYHAHAEQTAPAFAALPGIYAFDDVAAMRAYQGGTIFQRLQANPHMTDLTVRDFSVLAGPTKVTRGEY